MQKRVSWKYALPVIAFSVFLLLIVLLNSLNPSLAPQITTPPPTCVTPNTIPATITASMTLCGSISMTAPTIITNSNVLVTCAQGTRINYGGSPTAMFDAIQIASGVSGVRVSGCNFIGRFSSAIHLLSGVSGITIDSNTIDGAKNGIIEDYTAQNNIYSQNNIQNTGVAMKLEGSQGNTLNNVIMNNAVGIFTGIDSATLTSASPNAVCSLGLSPTSSAMQGNPPVWTPSPIPVICSIPSSGNMQRINSNSITNNVQGIVVYGIDNQINSNTIQSNQEGIEVNAIYLGSEINPNIQVSSMYPLANVQEYFNSGVRITSNTISNNHMVGIRTNGRSTYFFQSSPQYHRWTIINQNMITTNGALNTQDRAGIVLGSKYAINSQSPYFYSWAEYTRINNNLLNNNNNDGIVLESAQFTDIVDNTIQYNARNGLSVGTTQTSSYFPTLFPEVGFSRYTLHNSISNNQQHGIYVYNGHLWEAFLNEINSNKKGIYIPEAPSGDYSQNVLSIDCNDLSFNRQEGLDFDAKNSGGGSIFYLVGFVNQLTRNRVLNNGADGIRYYLDSSAYIGGIYLSPSRRTMRNHIEGNGFSPNPAYLGSGYGINSQGIYGTGFFANNFVNNARGSAFDSGSNTIENMWDEKQFEKNYDNLVASNCGGSCTAGCGMFLQCINGMCLPPPSAGFVCNPLTGNANVYSGGYGLHYATWPSPYVPRGNYGLAKVIPTSAAPPLNPTSCMGDSQCVTNSCENYPAPINNQQCGNGNFIYESNQFSGYYLPGTICPNIYYWAPFFGTFQPSESLAPEFLEENDGLFISPSEEEMYRGFPEEMKKDPMFREMLRDRRYIEQKNKESYKPEISVES